jgi:hypothetical protein
MKTGKVTYGKTEDAGRDEKERLLLHIPYPERRGKL